MRLIAVTLAALLLSACATMSMQQAAQPPVGFQGPRLEGDAFVSFDGSRLGLTRWDAVGEPKAVVVAVHGMNDYANAFHLAAPRWAADGVTTYAYDQRGFGRSPNRGVWGGDQLMVEDLRTMVALVRAERPGVPVIVAGESMGGAVAIQAFASDRPPPADRLILMAPAVWGWSNQPLPYKTTLWLAARVTPGKIYTPPRWLTERVQPTDNREELIAMGRDPLMVWGARSDTLYGLVRMMERAWRQVAMVKVPVLYVYGANDEIIPRKPSLQAARKLKPTDRSAFYDKGWHLMTRDRQGPTVIADLLAFIKDPAAPLPSGAPPIPGAPTLPNSAIAADSATMARAGL
ncbi:MAG: lysophospholipase [Phenylobacterium sp.]|uniref:alpha/beta hydrolase n=1 Tax=Phenylobacterium sp. TaxID=1871053 RepID=UPI0027363F90|nr:alpha/beta hydrolase [Phenylobacterium sp.]MDP3748913.1 lysophospholipase [Phenylobacterium sp.]